jgi:hypothetical protein
MRRALLSLMLTLGPAAVSVGCGPANRGDRFAEPPWDTGFDATPGFDASVANPFVSMPEAEAEDAGFVCPTPVFDASPDAACPDTAPRGGTPCVNHQQVCTYAMDGGYPGATKTHFAASCSGTTYTAAGACMSWQVSLLVDSISCLGDDAGLLVSGDGGTACADLPLVPCTLPHGPLNDTPQTAMDDELQSFVQLCGYLPEYSTLEVAFQNGCATGLALHPIGPAPDWDSFAACYWPLVSGVRWECAEGLSCAQANGACGLP